MHCRDKYARSTRGWYFLSDDEMKQVASGELHLQSYQDEPNQMTASARQLNDWRKALDYSQDWKWSTAAQTMGPGAAVNNYAGSRGLQRLSYEAVKYGDTGVYNSGYDENAPTYDDFVKQTASGQGAAWESGHSAAQTYGDYLINTVLKDHISALRTTQKEAAREAGFDKTYDTGYGSFWSQMYLDTRKGMPTAATAEELQQQLHDIEMMTDRSPLQRNFLAQKVQTRYWMQQVVNAGLSSRLQETLREDLDSTGLPESPAQPWQNAGEGWLPSLTGALAGSSAGDYMSEYNRQDLSKKSTEAAKNGTHYLNTYANGLDPNLLLDGIHWKSPGLLENDYQPVLDAYTGEKVLPGENSNWTELNLETGTYDLTNEGSAQVAKEREFLKLIEKHGVPKALTDKQRADLAKIRALRLGTPADAATGATAPDQKALDAADAEIADVVDDYNRNQQRIRLRTLGFSDDAINRMLGLEQEQSTQAEPPSTQADPSTQAEPTEDPYYVDGEKTLTDLYDDQSLREFGFSDRRIAAMHGISYNVPAGWTWKDGIYISPDGSRFGGDGTEVRGLEGHSKDMTIDEYVSVLAEAQQLADEEHQRNLEEEARNAKSAAERAVKLERLRTLKEWRHRVYLQNLRKEREAAAAATDDQPTSEETQQPAPPAVAQHVPMMHSVEHEEFNIPPMSSRLTEAIHNAERTSSVKVI